MPGRQVLEQAKALEALTAALKTTPDAAVKALKVGAVDVEGLSLPVICRIRHRAVKALAVHSSA